VVGLAIVAPRWDPALMSAGIYRPTQAANLGAYVRSLGEPGAVVRRGMMTEHVLYYREGINGSVMVGTDDEGRERWLRVGGKIDASTRDMETQVLRGLLPAALADSGARTLVIGLGSGITTAAVLAAGAGATDVCEIEPHVVDASRYFHPPGSHPLDDPRVHLVLGDARTQLDHGGGRYGLVVSEPSNPWIAGVNNLFTVDFYRRVRERLEPDGVFCQWLQLYELSPATFSSLVASFLDVFPHGQLFAVWRAVDLLLIACPESRALSLARLRSPAARRLLERARIVSPEALAGYYAGPLASFAGAARGAPLNRDDRPIVEYRAPRDLIAVGRSSLHGDARVIGLVPFAAAPPAGALFADWKPDDWYRDRASLFVDQRDLARARRVAQSAAAHGQPDLARQLERDIAAGERTRRGLAEVERARQLLEAGRQADGRAALERAVEIDPANLRSWVMLANQRRIAGDLAAAEAALSRGRTSADTGTRVEAALVQGMIEGQRRRPLAAAAQFREAERWNPSLARGYVFEAQALMESGDRVGALAALRRGLANNPRDRDLEGMMSRIGDSAAGQRP